MFFDVNKSYSSCLIQRGEIANPIPLSSNSHSKKEKSILNMTIAEVMQYLEEQGVPYYDEDNYINHSGVLPAIAPLRNKLDCDLTENQNKELKDFCERKIPLIYLYAEFMRQKYPSLLKLKFNDPASVKQSVYETEERLPLTIELHAPKNSYEGATIQLYDASICYNHVMYAFNSYLTILINHRFFSTCEYKEIVKLREFEAYTHTLLRVHVGLSIVSVSHDLCAYNYYTALMIDELYPFRFAIQNPKIYHLILSRQLKQCTKLLFKINPHKVFLDSTNDRSLFFLSFAYFSKFLYQIPLTQQDVVYLHKKETRINIIETILDMHYYKRLCMPGNQNSMVAKNFWTGKRIGEYLHLDAHACDKNYLYYTLMRILCDKKMKRAMI